MQRTLPILIDKARAVRDEQAARLRQSQAAVQQAGATLERLRAFRLDCLARSPAATLGRADGAALADSQRFVSRLDEAISAQQAEEQARRTAADAQQRLLLLAQQRLLAFDALDRRGARQRAALEDRREQRQSDEFAARAGARAQDGGAQ